MSKDDFLKILKDLNNLSIHFESNINTQPCCSFRTLDLLYKIIDKHVGLQNLDVFTKEKFPNEYKLLNTKQTKFFMFLLYNSCKFKFGLENILYLYSMLFYCSFIRKNLKYCDNQILDFAKNTLRSNSLFKKYSTISEVLRHISATIYSRFKDQFYEDCESFLIIRNLIYALRTSVANITKRLIKSYLEVKRNPEKFKTNESDIKNVVENIYRNLMFYGYIPKVKNCETLYDKFKQIPYLDETIVKSAIEEIIKLVYSLDKITVQKIGTNLHNLHFSKVLLEKLGIQITNRNLLCFVYTIIKLYRE